MATPDRASDHGSGGLAGFCWAEQLKSTGPWLINKRQDRASKPEAGTKHEPGIAATKSPNVGPPLLKRSLHPVFGQQLLIQVPERGLQGSAGLTDNFVGKNKRPTVPTQPRDHLERCRLRLEFIEPTEKFTSSRRLECTCPRIRQLHKQSRRILQDLLRGEWCDIGIRPCDGKFEIQLVPLITTLPLDADPRCGSRCFSLFHR